MEKTWPVEFRNISCSYFPESRVDCHYTVSSQHTWASADWIGLFKVGWSSVKEYHTFVWALAPNDFEEGTEFSCCVQFQASYLPCASSTQYEFVYIDAKGDVCSRSSSFTFSAPKPLEDLVTLEEDSHGEEAGNDMLLVVPRAELLQNHLQQCLHERTELIQLQKETNKLREQEKEEYKKAKQSWDRQSSNYEMEIARLQNDLKHAQDKQDKMKELQKETAFGESLLQDKCALMEEKDLCEQRIRELEEDIKIMAERTVERDIERVGVQKKEEESERINLQVNHEMRSLRERLSLSERTAEGLRNDLGAMVTQRDMGQAELHQARLQAAQLTLQLADSSLALREGKAHWAQEKQGLQQSTEMHHELIDKLHAEIQNLEETVQEEKMERVKLEVELGREKDCNRLQELKTSLRVTQKEKEQLQAEKDVSDHVLTRPNSSCLTVNSGITCTYTTLIQIMIIILPLVMLPSFQAVMGQYKDVIIH
uniref:Calcium binding and coiled-coil domain 1b n=1 Tax=Periophthalmus magnuspinnatus TaxID=409849 RepID=A0A3B4ABT0_9GOBI